MPPSPRARTASRHANPRERVLRAAIRLFAKNGFSGTTTRKIAAAARMNEALIFRYFPTKRHLYEAIIEAKIADDPVNALDDAAFAGKEIEEVLRALARRMFATVSADPSFLRLLYFSALEGHKLAEIFFDKYVQRLNRLMSDRIEQGIRQGELRKVDPYLAARAFIGMFGHYLLVQELFTSRHSKTPRFDPQQVEETFVSIFLRGLEIARG